MTALWLGSSSTGGEADMQKKTDKWMELCELAAKEQNPQKLMELTGEIIRLLDEQKQRISILGGRALERRGLKTCEPRRHARREPSHWRML
jgi:hypothetical protein